MIKKLDWFQWSRYGSYPMAKRTSKKVFRVFYNWHEGLSFNRQELHSEHSSMSDAILALRKRAAKPTFDHNLDTEVWREPELSGYYTIERHA